MRVEIDVSEVEYGDYYSDEKCKEVERILQSDSRYAECEVRRARWEDESNDDPFYVVDEKEEDIIMLDRWEVYALSGSEFISYIDVQCARNRASGRLETVMLSFATTAAFVLAFPIAACVSYYLGDHESFPVLMNLTVVAIILLFIMGILYYSMRRRTALRMKTIDLEAVGKDSSFLDVLRKLAELPETDKYKKRELLKRVMLAENALAGINS